MARLTDIIDLGGSGREVSLGHVWINLGGGLNRFKVPQDVSVLLHENDGRTLADSNTWLQRLMRKSPIFRSDGEVVDVLTIPMLHMLMRRSHSLRMPTRYPILARTDNTHITLSTIQDHVTELLGAYVQQHPRGVRVVSEAHSGVDVWFDGIPQQGGITTQMFHGRKTRVASFFRERDHTVVFDANKD